MGDKPERRNLHVVTELLLKFIFSCFRNAHRRRPDIICAGRDGCASLQVREQTYSPPNYIFIKTRTQMFELYVPTSASYVGFCTSGRNCIKRHLKVSESGLCADIFIYIYLHQLFPTWRSQDESKDKKKKSTSVPQIYVH